MSSVVIPDGVAVIGNDAFSYCESLKSIIIPDSVTSIGESAFEGCSSLTSLVLPDSVTSIRNSSFGVVLLWLVLLFQTVLPALEWCICRLQFVEESRSSGKCCQH